MSNRKRHRRRVTRAVVSIPDRASRVLQIILVIFFLILIRVWHLGVVQHDKRLEESRRPQCRVVSERAPRGTIRDRFNEPLAINRMQYNAAILYSPIREIPATRWERDSSGKRRKVYPRRSHIRAVAERIGEELLLDPERIEDLIHSKAALFPNVPYVLCEDITEEQFFRLRALEREYPGICAERAPLRYYPYGRMACDILGYMGSISQEQYESVAQEIRRLEGFLTDREEGRFPPLPDGFTSPSQVRNRVLELRERAYSIHDQVGKSGVESQYEEQLRGYRGRRSYLTDIYGNYLRQLPGGQEPLPGKRVILSISAELQQFAEELLAQNERIRDGRSHRFDRTSRIYAPLKQPWIKGGAIVAMEPSTGEILAMASYPRFDPNDYVAAGGEQERRKRRNQVLRWLESDAYLGQIWDRLRPLEREVYRATTHTMEDDQVELTWERYLQSVLPEKNAARKAMVEIKTIAEAVMLWRSFDAILGIASGWTPREVVDLLYCGEEDLPFGVRKEAAHQEAEAWLESEEVTQYRKTLDTVLHAVPRNYDKLLLLDLCRLATSGADFEDSLLDEIGGCSIASYREATSAMAAVNRVVQEIARQLFHEIDFSEWRERNQASFLKEKRLREKEAGRYQKPYLDYLDEQEGVLFKAFWERYRWDLLLAFLLGESSEQPDLSSYEECLCSWARELRQGAHKAVPWRHAYEELAQQVEPLSRDTALAYFRTMRSFNELDDPLYGRYRYIRGVLGMQKLRDLASAFYPKFGYGYGRSYAFRQAAPLGSIFKLITAYEAVIQKFREREVLGLSSVDLNPLTIVDDVHCKRGKGKEWNVGFFQDGRPIPMYYRGGRLLPTHRRNVGEIDLLGAMEVSSNSYFGLLIRDHMDSPSDLGLTASRLSFGRRTGIELPGEYAGRLPADLEENASGAYSFSVGQHTLVTTPLQTAVALSAFANGGEVMQPRIVHLIAGSDPVRRGEAVFSRRCHSFQQTLAVLGIDFPIFTSIDRGAQETEVVEPPCKAVEHIDLPSEVRNYLLQGLAAVVRGKRGGARPGSARSYQEYPWMASDYRALSQQIVGKTSTAEIVENVDLDVDEGTNIYNHIWFAGISFPEDQVVGEGAMLEFRTPDLVVVVYLRYADYGREAAPVAGQMIKKWREICGR